ncbi:hypothetical protein BVX95_01625 [archaeon D22]|nr:hypothetical protein BVX95_01625 [archaeon D22]
MKVSRMTIWNIHSAYKKEGTDGLQKKTKGRPFEELNPQFYKLVISEWKSNKCGARKLHEVLKRKGFGVSRRKIEQVLVKENLQKAVPKRKKPRKYKRYEWPIPNYMWHCDWHICKSERLKGQNIIVYIDDCSRKIMSYLLGDMTTKNSLFALYDAISTHGVMPHMLNSDRGVQFFPSKTDKDGKASHQFQIELANLGIIFIPSRVRHPQTNGKNEKWFDILESEFDERFENLEEFISWYNDTRLSEAVNYLTPNEAYEKRL